MIAILILLLTAITLYVVLGGADFGAGIWEFNTAFRSSRRERDLLYDAIGPVWETNHVWLIFVLVLLFGAFPPAFASINQSLFVPLFLALVGIVFRGAAYAFRSQFKNDAQKSRLWVVAFAFASVLAPFFLGAGVGAIASGEMEFDKDGKFSGSFLTGWVSPLSIYAGFFTVGLCAYCSAVYMIRESRQAKLPEIESIWRNRSLAVGVVMGFLSVVGLGLVAARYPLLFQGVQLRGWPALSVSLFCGFGSLWAIHRRRVDMAVVGAALTSGAVVVGWGLSQYPYILPPAWTVENSASPAEVVRVMLIATIVGGVFLVPAMILLFKIFKSPTKQCRK